MKHLLCLVLFVGLVGVAHADTSPPNTADDRPAKTSIAGVWKGDAPAGELSFLADDQYQWKRAADQCKQPACPAALMKGEFHYNGSMIILVKGLGKRDLYYNVTFGKDGKTLSLKHTQSEVRFSFAKQ